jgi:His Kinase A (phospho-acceptor) domain
MDLSNWIYLAAGLGVGLGTRWLLPPKSTIFPTNLNPMQPIPKPTEQNNSDQVLQQTQLAYLMAHQMSQFKGGFLARTSHELRSPLSNIIGLHQLILSDLCDDPAEERKFIAQANEAALQLVKLMDEVLNVARIEHGTNQISIQPLQLSFVLEEVCNITRMIVANRRHKLQLSPLDPEIYVLADPRWLRQIILSLIDAAMFCIDDGGTFNLSVSLVPESDLVSIWIDAPLATSTWNDPVDLMHSDRSYLELLNKSSDIQLDITPHQTPPGLVLLLNQTLLEVMHGKLDILPAPTDSEQAPTTRIQISIPQLTPDTSLLVPEP